MPSPLRRIGERLVPRGLLTHLYDHPWEVTAIATLLAGGGVALMAWAGGFHAVVDAFADLHPAWLVLCLGGQAAGFVGYVIAYRSLVRIHQGPDLSLGHAGRIVAAGFGPSAVAGGFAIDGRALHCATGEERESAVRVLGLGALEYAVLAPAAAISALVLLVTGGSVGKGLTLPWVIAVPVGFVLGLWLAAPKRATRVPRRGRVLRLLRDALDAMGILRTLLARPHRYVGAWVGTSLYWSAEIAAFYGGLRAFGVDPSLPAIIIAYATGYAATRRTLPIGGAGVTEVLLTLALHWVGVPRARALPPVVAYRWCNFVLPMIPAVRAHRRLQPLLEESGAAGREGRAVGDAWRIPARGADGITPPVTPAPAPTRSMSGRSHR